VGNRAPSLLATKWNFGFIAMVGCRPIARPAKGRTIPTAMQALIIFRHKNRNATYEKVNI
jgi:hypothetical protein